MENNPKVSVVIPTHNRPELLKRAIRSVLDQSFQDFEIIVVDDGVEERGEDVVRGFGDGRISYIKNEKSLGGSAARNIGIKAARAPFIAFLDDDDEWVKEKLEIQMGEFEKTDDSVGFSFTAVTNVKDDGQFDTKVPEGVADYHERALTRFSGFLTSTLIIKKPVFETVGFFDEQLPSHQEPDLIIRISSKYKGHGVGRPLTIMNLKKRVHINSSFENRIKGRETILRRYEDEFKKLPKVYAKHLFGLGIFYRDSGDLIGATRFIIQSLGFNFSIEKVVHCLVAPIIVLWRKIKIFLLTKTFFRPVHFGVWLRMVYYKKYSKRFFSKKIKTALDAGCGKGQYSFYLNQNNPQIKILAVDIVESQEWKSGIENLTFDKKDLLTLNDFGKYDLIYSIDVLEHIKNNSKVLKSFFDSLNDGGVLYLAMPCEKNLVKFFPEKYFFNFREWELYEHIGEQYDKKELEEKLQSLGFSIMYSRYTFTFFGKLAWELEYIINSSKKFRKLNIVLMPLYKFLGILDIYFPIYGGNILIVASK